MKDARSDVAQETSQQTEWIEIVEPKSKQRMFANLVTGECAWEPPLNVHVKKTKGNQWWELYDSNNTCRYYYYNPTTTETVWQRPFNCDIIPLAKLQLLKENTECASSSRSKKLNGIGNVCPHCSPRRSEQCGDSTNYSQFCDDINAALLNNSRCHHACQSPQQSRSTGEQSNMVAFNESFNENGGQADFARLLRNRDKQRNPSASFTYRKAQTSRSRPNPKESHSLQNASTVSELPSTIVAGHRSSAFCKGFRSYSPSSSLSSFGNHLTDVLSAESNPPEVHDSSRNNVCEFMCSTSANQPNMASAAAWAASAAAVGRRRCELRDASISSASSSVRIPYISASNSDTNSNNAFVGNVFSAQESAISSTETWTKNSLKSPLNPELNDKKLRKHALTQFKQIQSYMGDRKSKLSSDQIALSVVECCTSATADCGAGGESARALVDEVFLQMLKQLFNNPRVDSIRRGWELLGIFLFFFAPSPKSYEQVLKFVESYSDPILDTPEFGASQYAKHCMKRLQLSRPQSTLNGSHSSNSVVAITCARPSTVEAIRQARYNIFYPSKFGTTLEELMEMQAPQFPHLKIPWIQATLIRMILEGGGERTEGLFRIASDPEQLNTALIQLEVWVKPVVKDAHVPAALLKQWLRQLPAPLIPSDLYEQCLSATSTPKTVAESCCQLLDALPEINRLVLAALTQLLQRLCRNDETVRHTKMDVANLAMVMAPNVLRCESADPAVIFANSRKEMEFMKTVILHYDTSAYTFDSLCV